MSDRPSLLIIEGNHARLHREGHTRFTDSIVDEVRRDPDVQVLRVALSSREDFQKAQTLIAFARVQSAMLLAHANPMGLEISDSDGVSWTEFASLLRPTGVKHLLSVACFGGTSLATNELFEGIPSLDRVVGSPSFLTAAQATLPTFELLRSVYGGQIPTQYSYALNVVNAVATRGVLFTRERSGLATSSAGDRLLEDFMGMMAKAALAAEEPPRRRIPNRTRRARS